MLSFTEYYLKKIKINLFICFDKYQMGYRLTWSHMWPSRTSSTKSILQIVISVIEIITTNEQERININGLEKTDSKCKNIKKRNTSIFELK